MRKIFFAIAVSSMLLTQAVSAQSITNGCIGICGQKLTDDDLYERGSDNYMANIKPNMVIRSKNMSVFNQLFARSKILFSERKNVQDYVIHEYNLLINFFYNSAKKSYYAICEMKFKDWETSLDFFEGECFAWEGNDNIGIAKFLKDNIEDD